MGVMAGSPHSCGSTARLSTSTVSRFWAAREHGQLIGLKVLIEDFAIAETNLFAQNQAQSHVDAALNLQFDVF